MALETWRMFMWRNLKSASIVAALTNGKQGVGTGRESHRQPAQGHTVTPADTASAPDHTGRAPARLHPQSGQ